MPNTPHASCNASSFSVLDEVEVKEVMEDSIVSIRFFYSLVLTGFGRFKGNAVFLSIMWGFVASLLADLVAGLVRTLAIRSFRKRC